MRDIKKYDRLLFVEKKLDGSKSIKRKSPFNAQRDFKVFDIENKYTGSFNWIITRLNSMDNQRYDLIGKSMSNNLEIRNKKEDDRISKDLANFIAKGGESIIL